MSRPDIRGIKRVELLSVFARLANVYTQHDEPFLAFSGKTCICKSSPK